MSYLLDTHAFLWWLADDKRLSRRARVILTNKGNRLMWSAASTWELAIKAGLGRIRFAEPVESFLQRFLAEQGVGILPISHAHAAAVEHLPPHHGDPFDRLLIAQAQTEKLTLISADAWARAYAVQVAW